MAAAQIPNPMAVPTLDAEGYSKRGVVLLKQGQLVEAIAHLRQALRMQPRSARTVSNLGVALVQQGDVQEAIRCYQQALQIRPAYAQAHHNLGDAYHKQGRLKEATACYEESLRLKPDLADTHFNLGLALAEQGQLADAVASYRQALRLQPHSARTHGHLAAVLQKLGQHDEAAQRLATALRLQGNSAEAFNSLGATLEEQGQLDEAIRHYRQAQQLNPADAEAYQNLGNALRRQGLYDQAIAQYEQALLLRPDAPRTHNNLAVALEKQGRIDQAMVHYRKALHLKPDYPEPHHNLGNAFRAKGQFDQALAHYRQALRLRPQAADTYNNLGVAFTEQGRMEEALQHFHQALELRPDFAEARKNRALAWLVMGDFEQGWLEYEWRWQEPGAKPRTFVQPRWDGEPLEGRTILLYTEQGRGDVLQFIRYAALVKQRGGTVVVECPDALVRLLTRCPGIDRLVAQGSPLPEFDVQAPLLSLPLILHTTLTTVPGTVPYLFADDALVEHWRGVLGCVAGFKIGIGWQGNPRYAGDRQRSIPLAEFAPVAALPGVRLFSLQKGWGSEQLAAVADSWPIVDLGRHLDEANGAFLDTAAVMKTLDLVITSDTALAHLAGALGIPVWVPLPYAADWRWLLQREDSPWYPTMRLFRQKVWGDWPEVFGRIAGELQPQLPPSPAAAIVIEITPGELLDRIAVLELQRSRTTDPEELGRVRVALGALLAARLRLGGQSEQLATWSAELKVIHAALEAAEEDIDRCEQAGELGPRFTELAHLAHQHRARRAALLREINLHLQPG